MSFADSPNQRKSGRIKLRTDAGEYTIAIPKGILSDIVKPHFDEVVAIRARRRASQIYEFVDFVER